MKFGQGVNQMLVIFVFLDAMPMLIHQRMKEER